MDNAINLIFFPKTKLSFVRWWFIWKRVAIGIFPYLQSG
jgi:hypothetical protein